MHALHAMSQILRRQLRRHRSLMSYLLLFVVTACFQCSTFPPGFEFPEPTGPFDIGTRYFYFVDQQRPDSYTVDPDDHRELSVQVWYPAEPNASSAPTTYDHRKPAQHFVELGVFKPAFVNEVALKPTHSYRNADIAEGTMKYPVILFSASGAINGNSLLFEELASHGYVVVRLGHPYWCDFYFDADGEAFALNKENEYYKKMWEEEGSAIVGQTKQALTRATTAEEKLIFQKKLNEQMPTEINDVRLWIGDMRFIIDQLDLLNQSDGIFHGKLDVRRIGVMGYSKGGAAAGQACLTESWVKAGVNLSGFMFGDIGEKTMTVPFMVMEAVEPWCQDCPPINDLLFHTSESSVYMLQIHNSTHANFSDLPAYREYLADDFQNILGSIDGRTFLKIQNEYVRSFFDRYLKDLPAPLLDNTQGEYPEVSYKFRHPGGH